jgi:hypothetical protein
MSRAPSPSGERARAFGCGCLLPPLLGFGVAAWLLRNGIHSASETELALAGVIVLSSLAFGFTLHLQARRRRARALTASREESTVPMTGTKRQLGKDRRTMRFAFGAFFVVGLAFLIPFALMLWRFVESQWWEEARCTVLSSEVRTHQSDEGSTYSVDIRYRYRWNGDHYEGNRYNFTFGSSSGYDGKAAIVEQYPEGAEVPCWVDADRPEKSVLRRTVGWEVLFILLPLAFVTVGLLGLMGSFGAFSAFGGAGALRRDDWLPGTTAEERAPPAAIAGTAGPDSLTRRSFRTPGAIPLPADPSTDPNVLDSGSTPTGRLIGSIFVAAIWNGLVWLGIYFVLIRDGERDGCAVAFLGVFALIGLILFLSVPYYALALANPRLKARIGNVLVPGRRTTLSWRFEGKPDRIRRLIIKLEGREEAKYRKGTRTYTDKEMFYEKVILETTDQHRIRSGQTPLEIPSGTMHSFDGGNNKVLWTLSVRGDIPRWPDVKEEFAVTVRPEGLGR